ncbi:MAG: T9SS type A sorting domain-containing protein [Flavobacteriaceae bacterium]
MKNLQLTLLLLVSTFTAFSQLYVAPNATSSTDSYIYVNDEVLFVEQDVNLVANSFNADTEASIYLRNDGQLIQGATSSNNDGTGLLSVYQTIDSTSYYHYTFWHSPVGLASGAAGNTMAGVSRLYDSDAGHITRSNQALTTANSTGSNGNPITISTRWIYKRLSSVSNETEALYQYIGAGNTIEPYYGFTMKGIGADPGAGFNSQTYDFRGRPYNGDISVPIIASATAASIDDKWTLTGNPYASAIDLKLFFADNTANGLNAILYWDEPKDSEFHHNYNTHSGGYGVWIPGAGTGANDPGVYTAASFRPYDENGYTTGTTTVGADYDRRYAPIGQGFVIQTNNPAITNINFTNSQRVFRKVEDVSDMRTSETNSLSTDPGNTEPAEEIIPKIRLHINYNDGPTRELLLIFHENSTDGYDVGLDAPLPINTNGTDAYFPIGSDTERYPFVIQTVPFEIEKRVPITFFTNQQRSVSVIADEIINIFGSIYLWDSQEDIYREILEVDNTTVGSNNNSFILPAGIHDSRYFIVFKNRREVNESSEGTLAIAKAQDNVSFFQNNPYKQLEISNPEGYNIKNAQVFDMLGKLVVDRSNLGSSRNLSISTANLSDGVYIIRLLTSENVNIDYKMIIKNN